jgi:hypothetical protein
MKLFPLKCFTKLDDLPSEQAQLRLAETASKKRLSAVAFIRVHNAKVFPPNVFWTSKVKVTRAHISTTRHIQLKLQTSTCPSNFLAFSWALRQRLGEQPQIIYLRENKETARVNQSRSQIRRRLVDSNSILQTTISFPDIQASAHKMAMAIGPLKDHLFSCIWMTQAKK